MSDKIEERMLNGILAICVIGIIGVFFIATINIPVIGVAMVVIVFIAYLFGYIIERVIERKE